MARARLSALRSTGRRDWPRPTFLAARLSCDWTPTTDIRLKAARGAPLAPRAPAPGDSPPAKELRQGWLARRSDPLSAESALEDRGSGSGTPQPNRTCTGARDGRRAAPPGERGVSRRRFTAGFQSCGEVT